MKNYEVSLDMWAKATQLEIYINKVVTLIQANFISIACVSSLNNKSLKA